MNPILLALAISLAANAAIGWAWLGARDEVAAGAVLLEDARGAASACSDATEALRELSDKRAAEAKTARAAAAAKAQTHDQKADAILSKPATSTDDCKAAADRKTEWLKGRK